MSYNLIKYIIFLFRETFGLLNSLYVLLKGQKHPMDLFSAQNRQQKIYGFLGVSWGFVSDVDIESEKFRALGVLRFTLGALQRIMGLRHYHGTFYYIPTSANAQENGKKTELGVEQCVTSKVPDSNNDSPAVIRTGAGDSGDGNIELSAKQNGIHSNIYGPKSSLPSLDTPLGEGWEVVKGEFVLLSLCSLSHLGSGMHSSPGIFFNDGVLDIQYVHKGATKKTMLELLGAFETGKHIECPDVQRVYGKAFRLVPGKEPVGHVAVDGEEVEYGPIQGEIFPSLANIILLKG